MGISQAILLDFFRTVWYILFNNISRFIRRNRSEEKVEEFSRSAILFGQDGLDKISHSKVAVFGLGGVGGYVAEALARAGVGELYLIDGDKIALSNINRQIYALHSTVGQFKAEVAKKRIEDINPNCKVTALNMFFLPETEFDFSGFDYVVDAIDTVTGKIEIICRAKAAGVPVISAMGAGNKLDATAFKVAYIEDTRVCPLARVMRREIKKRGVEKVKVVYSEEEPVAGEKVFDQNGKAVPASNSYVPPVVGLIIAGEIIKYLVR